MEWVEARKTREGVLRYWEHRDAMFEVMRAFGVDVDNYSCPDDICNGGRGCYACEDLAVEVFSELWDVE